MSGMVQASFALYVMGFPERGGVVIALVLFAYYFFFSFMQRRDPLELAVKMTPFAIAGWRWSAASDAAASVENGHGLGWHIPRERVIHRYWHTQSARSRSTLGDG
jgi:hypothetical protein